MLNNSLSRRLKEKLMRARKLYARALKGSAEGRISEWLSDNYYVIEKEAKQAIKALRKIKLPGLDERGLPRLFCDCLSICSSGEPVTTEMLSERLGERDLSVSESQLLELMLRCALVDVAVESSGGEKESVELFSHAIKSLKNLNEVDFEKVLQNVSRLEQLLSSDPAGIYSQTDDKTRSLYRNQIMKKAKKSGESELEIAQDALRKAKNAENPNENHIGKYLLESAAHLVRGKVFLALEISLPVLLSAALSVVLKKWYVFPLCIFPLWEILRPLVERASLKGVQPSYLPRLKAESGAVAESHSLITVSTLLTGAKDAKKMKESMLQLWRSNGAENISVCFLADLKAAPTPERPDDSACVKASVRAVEELNRDFGNHFFLVVRKRSYSKTQGCYTGKERKRGAISELIRAIKGEFNNFTAFVGSKALFEKTQFIIALDRDTLLPMDTASELVAVALHPQNRPVIDTEKGAVTGGYGILAPVIENELFSASATAFEKLMAGEGGITAYASSASERYQDLFGESIFSGKGLIDVEAFHTLLCKDPFQEELVLSHDILESGYLRTGFISDLQAADGFPKHQGSYFARLSRWIRGDWQNLRFIFNENPMNFLSRFKLFDNLRRSITPVLAMLGILVSLLLPPVPGGIITAACVLSICAGELLGAAGSFIRGGFKMLSRLYYSEVMPAAMSGIVRAAIGVIMLPKTAAIGLSSILRALWRQLFSKKNLLEWTTAAQGDASQTKAKIIAGCWPCIAASALLFAFGGQAHKLLAILFVINLPFALFSGKPAGGLRKRMSYSQREKLTSHAAAMWKYFEEFCTLENNYLPPDNVQETPAYAVAHRTSPTNIGLALLCFLAARDFGFISSGELYNRLDQSITSIEKLKKWNGNLLNWYDTTNLMPLHPEYVSTVDNGNFLCSLVALRSGIREYTGDESRLAHLATRITALIDACDLTPLYNSHRKLFHIGIDLTTGEPSPSYYDLLMSEARMTGYFAIASRQVPKSHWGALGRTLAEDGRFTGPVSWTGTMFEYFMPNIFLPAPRGSMSYEGLRFCLWCQQKRTGRQDLPWGISESGFYAFDRDLNYQYKAHGVQKLGLRRGLDTETVISPYSTFLALPFAPSEALKNISRLEQFELFGRCGFYEAVDFTKSRTGTMDYAVVRSYMAHHIGMSLLCVLNTLNKNVVQRRFMADNKMAAASSLLLEKIASGATVFNDVEVRETPKIREHIESKSVEFDDMTLRSPRMKLLSNGEWTTAITDIGTGFSIYRGVNVTRHSSDILNDPLGVFAVAHTKKGSFPVSSALKNDNKTRFTAEFDERRVTHTAKQNHLEFKMRTSVHSKIPCEQRQISLKNLEAGEMSVELVLYFEPSLQYAGQEAAHPAFDKLFLCDEFDKESNLLLFTRRPREKGHPLCLAAGFCENVDFTFETAREKALKCPQGVFSLTEQPPAFSGGRGNPNACAAVSIKLNLAPRSTKSITLLMACASTEGEAVNYLIRARETAGRQSRGAPSPFVQGELDSVMAESVVPRLFYPLTLSNETVSAISGGSIRGRGPLWSVGVSGDNPVMFIEVHNEEDALRALPYIKINKKLRACSIVTDLIIAYREGGDYGTPIFNAVREMLKSENYESALDASGGVRAVNLSQKTDEEYYAIIASANFIAPSASGRINLPQKLCKFQKKYALRIKKHEKESLMSVKGGDFTEGGFVVDKSGKMSELPWCHVLANKNFGTLVSDKSLGFTWAVNSRECKLTPWSNNSSTDNTGEKLFALIEGRCFDLISGSEACFSRSSASWRGFTSGVFFETEVRVPAKGMEKRCTIKIKNTSEKLREINLAYYIEPVLGIDRSNSQHITGRVLQNGAVITSNMSEIRGSASLLCSKNADFVSFDRIAFHEGNWSSEASLPRSDCCVAVGTKVTLAPGKETSLFFSLCWAACSEAAIIMPSVSRFEEPKSPAITIKTPDEYLNNLFNSLLPVQIINSRFFGRTGFYQCGGAWGFRDQLQDSLALISEFPDLVKTHIMRCCAVQFEQGDVLHWWHSMPKSSGGLRGVRTKCSDDLLWLPYVTAEYVEKTGDTSILDVSIPFIKGEELKGESERYFNPDRSEMKASVYDHCVLAVERAATFGEHGLPLIGNGDWNDGFSRVGVKGRGESVWLAQFIIIVLEKMTALARLKNDSIRANDFARLSRLYHTSVEENAWGEDHYLRAFYDDMTPMGATGAAECAIDSLPQSFAAIARLPNSQRIESGLNKALGSLVDYKHGIVKVFSPPFSGKGARPGYIAAYPQGIRENGGQYTHAAVWLAMALITCGRADEGCGLLRLINPARLSANERQAERYRAEPYALAGDVSGAPGIEGRAGWSLYTGSAAWYYNAVAELIFGIIRQKDKLLIKPNLPKKWNECSAELFINGKRISLKIERGEDEGLFVDGKPAEFIPLNGSNHNAVFRLK